TKYMNFSRYYSGAFDPNIMSIIPLFFHPYDKKFTLHNYVFYFITKFSATLPPNELHNHKKSFSQILPLKSNTWNYFTRAWYPVIKKQKHFGS
ncbi:hypothetical protein, partial [Acetivibrio ethanolgignens]|uniref:hypothetical protein n=1 Tax=Acetivibrio ethanolgignens TaxID=290052 RepID=UPI001A9A4D67